MIPYAAPRAHPPSCMGNMEQDWLPTAVMPSSAMPGNDLPGAEAEKRKIRLEKNRIAAKESRKRKKQHTSEYWLVNYDRTPTITFKPAQMTCRKAWRSS